MIRVDRAVVGCLVAAGVLTGVAACGSEAGPNPEGAQTLVAPPATVPANYTTIDAMKSQLTGVANCVTNGPNSVVCTLLTTTNNASQIAAITPFQMKVFPNATERDGYLAFVRGANAAYAQTGSAKREILVGPTWVVTPQVDTSGLIATLQTYLGGQTSS